MAFALAKVMSNDTLISGLPEIHLDTIKYNFHT